jgi:phosphoribosylanthranilate isomerase
MMVKICGITNPEDAQVAVDHGASAIGLVFYPRSPRYVTPAQAAGILSSLRGSVWKVGVFVDEPGERVAAIASELGLDIAQLHGSETPADYPVGLRVWKARRVKGGFDASAFESDPAEALMLDGPATGLSFDWNIAAQLRGKVIIAGGLDASNVREAIERARPWGVDASSRLESSPGRKDRTKLELFLRAALG